MDGIETSYRIPKEQVAAEVRLPGQPLRSIRVHVSTHAEQHYGRERPSDLLNGTQTFLPVLEGEDGVRFLPREAILVLTVPAAAESRVDPAAEAASGWEDGTMRRREDVDVHLVDGSRVAGTVTYYPPAGHDRLLDFLNSHQDFFPVRDGDRVHLVNKRRVAWITPL